MHKLIVDSLVPVGRDSDRDKEADEPHHGDRCVGCETPVSALEIRRTNRQRAQHGLPQDGEN